MAENPFLTFKTLKRILLSVAVVLITFAAAWVAVNAWPMAAEPELWADYDLSVKEDPVKNGWHALSRENEPFDSGFLIPPDALLNLIPPSGPSDSSFWNQTLKLKAELDSFIKEHQKAIDAYEAILAYPQFTDATTPSLEKLGAGHIDILYFQQLHQTGVLYLINEAVHDRWENVYGMGLKMFRHDISFLHTAHTMLNQLMAVNMMLTDVKILGLLKKHHPVGQWETFLEGFNSKSCRETSFEPALVFEYRYELMALDGVIPETTQKSLHHLLFNRNRSLHDIRERFQVYQSMLKRPEAIPDGWEDDMDRKQNLPKNAFWWFVNPGGKALETMILSVPVSRQMKSFYAKKEEICGALGALK